MTCNCIANHQGKCAVPCCKGAVSVKNFTPTSKAGAAMFYQMVQESRKTLEVHHGT